MSSSELLLLHTSMMSAPDSATSFRPEDHTDWEIAPPSYDPQSSGSLDLNEHLRIFSSMLDIFLQFCLHFLENFSSGLLIYSQG